MAAHKAAKDVRTIFIRGVSFDANEKDIEELFSDVGPVKQCFLVRVKDQPKHRGFGFVQYALPEDAERAVNECNGKNLKGRKLQVELADKRAPLEERKKKRKLGQDGDENADDTTKATAPAPASRTSTKGSGPKAAATAAKKVGDEDAEAAAAAAARPDGGDVAAAAALPPRKRQRAGAASASAAAGASEKHKLLRAVAVGNLTPASISQAISLARKVAPAEEVLNPAPPEIVQQAKLEADGCSGSVVIVIYKTVKDAMHAVTQLHNKTLELRNPNPKQQQQQQRRGKKGRKGTSEHQHQQHDEDEETDEEEKAGVLEAGAQQQQQQQQQVTAAATRITLWAREVKGEGAHVKQWRVILRNLPFKITEPALLKVLSPVGFVWDLKLPRAPDGRLKGFAFATFTCRAHADKAIATINGKDLMGRMVVVDWAVSKTQYLQGGPGAPAATTAAGAAAAGKGGSDGGSEDPDHAVAGFEEDQEAEDGPSSGEEEEGEEEEEIGLGTDDDDEDGGDDDDDDDEAEEEEEEEEEGRGKAFGTYVTFVAFVASCYLDEPSSIFANVYGCTACPNSLCRNFKIKIS
ncbi:hypothetical protein Vretimale_17951 [Volvox reticuliferus]|uniref:RRM domain-containing protein n=1 Tax=Volvox reticuliferus TaxID=1737510 RepID=A0A8J4GW89_9CHLO|nr:hypothetical protein Vretimale_17951 [Volvox reticuliferus]